MKASWVVISILFLNLTTTNTFCQVTTRPRPAKWDSLITGGKFMDRFMPMPVMGELTSDTWGAPGTVPRYTENGLEDNVRSYWGGNVIKGEAGKYHLYVCGWREDSPKGHMFWPKSSVFHAVAENSFGPYTVTDSIGFGHNPEVFRISDGRYVIYVIDGYYISNSLYGPWEKGKFEFDPRDRKIIEGLSNLTFTQREDGTFLMVCRGGGIWISETGISPYYQVTDRSVYPDVDGNFEDPVVWRTNVQYHMIVNDWKGRIAYYLRSKDGINWIVDPGEAYMPGISIYEDGTKVDWFKYERIKVLQDEYGRATQAHFAVIDTIKWNDLENDNHSSKHIVIPLKKGKLFKILDDKPIRQSTKTIRLKIQAEEDFDPHNDIDLKSLRFGAPEAVNYGRGCQPVDSEELGDDLLIIFNSKGNEFNKGNFAGKLIGKKKNGDWFFGYSRLPCVIYKDEAVSARAPKIIEEGDQRFVEVEIQNFGEAKSRKSYINVLHVKHNLRNKIAQGVIKELDPLEKTILKFPVSSDIDFGPDPEIVVVIK